MKFSRSLTLFAAAVAAAASAGVFATGVVASDSTKGFETVIGTQRNLSQCVASVTSTTLQKARSTATVSVSTSKPNSCPGATMYVTVEDSKGKLSSGSLPLSNPQAGPFAVIVTGEVKPNKNLPLTYSVALG